MRATFETMGTVASITWDRPVSLEPTRRIFALYDRTFSLYDPASELSRLARGEQPLRDAAPLVRDEYARAVRWRDLTLGWFTPHRPDGVIDLSGTIKAVAIAEAVADLEARGARGLLGVGGDIAVIGDPEPSAIGVIDPLDSTRMLARVDLGERRAIATSGSAERGDHIWSRLGRSDVVQATVLAADIVTADVAATAIVAAGTDHLDELTQALPVDALVVCADGLLLATPGFVEAAHRVRTIDS